MIQFHIYAANTQLQQLYYGFIAALTLDRVLVMPKFQCFCAKNWYMTQSCRINGERHSTFPYDCALREHTFMANRNVPDEIKVRWW
ncbi:hypothetical protein FOA52_000630 [Chlamydomonas sp. UWO 241]|nr:hypothetical protein FOA52_000630 [Chlamydomonas sp. UWO 241]